MPLRTAVEKPVMEAVISYGPGGRLGAEYTPSVFDVTSLVIPLAVFFMTTVTPGRAPPDSSVKVPESVAPVTWESAVDGFATSNDRLSATIDRTICRICRTCV